MVNIDSLPTCKLLICVLCYCRSSPIPQERSGLEVLNSQSVLALLCPCLLPTSPSTSTTRRSPTRGVTSVTSSFLEHQVSLGSCNSMLKVSTVNVLTQSMKIIDIFSFNSFSICWFTVCWSIKAVASQCHNDSSVLVTSNDRSHGCAQVCKNALRC